MTRLFVALGQDRPGALDLRLATRDAHSAHVVAHTPHIVKLAGPFLDEQGQMVGSMLILSADSLEAAEAFMAADPYVQAGLFETLSITPWRLGIGNIAE